MKKALEYTAYAVLAAILVAAVYFYLFHIEVGVNYIRFVNLPW
jgi:hypothetical protein